VDLHAHVLDHLAARIGRRSIDDVGDREAVEEIVVRTVGTVTAIRKTLRPTLGSVSSVLASRTSACDALEVSMSGASAVTVIVSWSVPTSIVTSSVTNVCVEIRMPRRSKVLNPATAARIM
jgi:hypothetical protein